MVEALRPIDTIRVTVVKLTKPYSKQAAIARNEILFKVLGTKINIVILDFFSQINIAFPSEKILEISTLF